MKVQYKKDGKMIRRIVTTKIQIGSLKGKITRTENDVKQATDQAKIWNQIAEKKAKELADLKGILQ